MTKPVRYTDLQTYESVGAPITNLNFDFDLQYFINALSDGTYDLTFNSFNVSSNSNMNGALINNVGNGISANDAITFGQAKNLSVSNGYSYGFQCSNDPNNPTTQVDITSGVCKDDTNTIAMQLNETLTKSLNFTFATGTGNGALDTGSITASSTYHLFVIQDNSQNIDILASLSATNPQLPPGFVYKRRIPNGAFMTDSLSHIISVYKQNRLNLLQTPLLDIADTSGCTNTATLRTLTVPSGISTNVLIYAYMVGASSTDFQYALITSPLVLDTTPQVVTGDSAPYPLYSSGNGVFNLLSFNGSGIAFYAPFSGTILTDKLQQIRTRNSSINSVELFNIVNFGWYDNN